MSRKAVKRGGRIGGGGLFAGADAGWDELGAGVLEGASDALDGAGGDAVAAVRGFEAADGDDGHLGATSQLILLDAEEGASGANLFWSDHGER